MWVIIIGATYLDECAGPATFTFTIRARVNLVHMLQSTLESAAFEGCIIYTFTLLKNSFTWSES